MKPTDIIQETVWEDSKVVEMARFLVAGVAGVQSDIATIVRKIFDLSNNNIEIDSDNLVVANVIFDTLQTGGRWTKDPIGYNFLDQVPYTSFPTGSHRYRVQYLFTGGGGTRFYIVYEHKAKQVYSS